MASDTAHGSELGALSFHVAALPFPSQQGTQAAVGGMMHALSRCGRAAHLLTYGEGGPHAPGAWTLHRGIRPPGGPNLRSGPSLGKLVQDALLIPQIRQLTRALSPPAVIAHHVEATSICLVARARPLVFFAHTALGPELPTYGPRLVGPLLGRAGTGLDRILARRANAVACVSPALRDEVERLAQRDAMYVPIPWEVPEAIDEHERPRARASLALGEGPVLLYAGNLDRYQGWELLVDALPRVVKTHPEATLLVATRSEDAELRKRAHAAGVAEHIVVRPLVDEAGRREIHAAADVVVVPRRSPGGVPVKLLDAMARGVPVVAASRATAGLSLGGGAMIAADDDADALANGALVALAAPGAASSVGTLGRAYVASEHHASVFVSALDRAIARAIEHAAP